MIACIDDHRAVCGVEPICRQLPITPSIYRRHAARRAAPLTALPRIQRDARLHTEIRWAENDNFRV
jgi:hypothetical protein